MMRVLPAAAILACTVSGTVLAASCGPSFRRTYESDNAFTRCFDLDYRPGAGAEAKTVCWRHWLDRHVYNQPDDKLEYASLRLEELAAGVSVPGPPGPPGAFHQRPAPAVDDGAPPAIVEHAAADGGVDGGAIFE